MCMAGLPNGGRRMTGIGSSLGPMVRLRCANDWRNVGGSMLPDGRDPVRSDGP